MISIALVDDHVLLRNGFADLLDKLGFEVIIQADNGKDFIEKLSVGRLPDIVLVDTDMSGMSGSETTLWIRNNHPGIKVMSFAMREQEEAILQMRECGAKGYIFKDCEPSEIKKAIKAMMEKGQYFSPLFPYF